MTTATSPEVSIIGKITIKGIGANPKRAIKEEKKVLLANIYGTVSGTKQVENRINGNCDEALLGMFEAHNCESGEIFRAGKLFLPSTAQNLVVAEIKRLLGQDDNATVTFGFEISAAPSEKAPIGYEYHVKSLLKPEVADPLEQMREKIFGTKQLPAASTAHEKEAKKK